MAGMTRPVLTAPLFDANFGKQPAARPEKLWGRPAIAQALGVSVDTVVSLARNADCPIYMPAGRYFAYRSELERWLRTKPAG
jgi:hypothetical protein